MQKIAKGMKKNSSDHDKEFFLSQEAKQDFAGLVHFLSFVPQ